MNGSDDGGILLQNGLNDCFQGLQPLSPFLIKRCVLGRGQSLGEYSLLVLTWAGERYRYPVERQARGTRGSGQMM